VCDKGSCQKSESKSLAGPKHQSEPPRFGSRRDRACPRSRAPALSRTISRFDSVHLHRDEDTADTSPVLLKSLMPPKRTWSQVTDNGPLLSPSASRPRQSEPGVEGLKLEATTPAISRKVKACAACRKQKVRSDICPRDTEELC